MIGTKDAVVPALAEADCLEVLAGSTLHGRSCVATPLTNEMHHGRAVEHATLTVRVRVSAEAWKDLSNPFEQIHGVPQLRKVHGDHLPGNFLAGPGSSESPRNRPGRPKKSPQGLSNNRVVL
jgi:hypothetical protein